MFVFMYIFDQWIYIVAYVVYNCKFPTIYLIVIIITISST